MTVQKLFPLAVYGRRLEFRYVANVGSVSDMSGMVANVGVAVGIVSPAHCVQ